MLSLDAIIYYTVLIIAVVVSYFAWGPGKEH